ncbi:MAG TPA: YlzJ-like family protein [Candidatus Deferrimicrobium sp.]|nr:YlzJ-like family protein [Candidatus Deferrimicrobium sp.]
MLYWTPLELEQVFEGWDNLKLQLTQVSYDGVIMEVKPLGDGTGEIVRLLSTEPLDYLNSEYAPGNIINIV